MTGGRSGPILAQIQRLFGAGTVAGLAEEQLLERFINRRDGDAFAALVARHGPLVLGVCRRILRDEHAVEDAFQATFLILARKAGSIRDRELLGNWLYGVALRVATRARADAARRRDRERPGDVEEALDRAPSPVDRLDLRPVLDEELARLPERYRAAIVLCHLEGLSHEEAARRLDCPVGTVRSRLARGRDRLRDRLTRRGFALTAGVLATTLIPELTSAALPPALVERTVRAALQWIAGVGPAGVVSAGAVALMEGVLTTMFATKLKVLASAVAAIGLFTTGAVLATQGPGPDAGKPAGNPPPAQEKAVEKDFGKVGRPLADVNDQSANQHIREILKERIATARAVYEQTLRRTMEQTPPNPDELGSWSRRWAEDQRDLAGTPAERVAALQAHVVRVKGTERLLGDYARTGQARESDALKAKYYRLEAEQLLAEERAGLGHRQAAAPAANDPRDERVRDALAKPVAMPFAHATPIGDVLKYIKIATNSPKLPDGIPIYIDPKGLLKAGKTLNSPVSLSLEGIALGKSLELLLDQVDLRYEVEEGVLIIREEVAVEPKTTEAILRRLAAPISLEFRNATPLENVIRTIKDVTQGPDLPDGIPIFVDPVELQEAEKTLNTPIRCDFKEVRLGRCLEQILDPLDLRYEVKDGLLTIRAKAGIRPEGRPGKPRGKAIEPPKS